MEAIPPSPPPPELKTLGDQGRYFARRDDPPRLTFGPLAWLKLQMLLHAGDTEVGGFALSADDDLLYVADVLSVAQETTAVTVRFDDAAVADHFDRCVDRGVPPCRFARIWVHTHPGDSPQPSLTDEETFARVFGRCDWAVMCIVSRTGRTYARLSFSAGPGGSLLLPVVVDWASWPTVALEQVEQITGLLCDWVAEYAANVRRPPPRPRRRERRVALQDEGKPDHHAAGDDLLAERLAPEDVELYGLHLDLWAAERAEMEARAEMDAEEEMEAAAAMEQAAGGGSEVPA